MNTPLLGIPAMLLLEIMDKEPSLAQRAILYVVLTVVSVLLTRNRWWLGLVVLPVIAFFAFADVSELLDPAAGPAIVEEAGRLHVVLWYSLILASLTVPLLTAALSRRGKSL